MQELIPLVGCVLNLFLALFVLGRGHRSLAIRVYSLLGLCIAVWNLGTYFLFVVNDQKDALFWARFLQFGVIFIPVLLFHLSLLLAQIPVGRYIYVLYALHGILALTNLTDLFLNADPSASVGVFVKNVKHVSYAYYSVAGPGFWAYSTLFAQLHVSVVVLLKKRRKLPPLHRKRLTGLIVAAGSLAVFGLNDILPILQIYKYPLTDTEVYPFGSMAAIFYGLIVGYSVLQHQLLDIRVTLGKIAANLVRLLFVFLIGLFLFLVVSRIAPENTFNRLSLVLSLTVLLTTAVVASVYFPRLFGKGDDVLERRLLGDRFEYHDKVQGFIQSIHAYTDAGLLMDDLHDLLINTVKVRSYEIILLDETTRVFALYRSFPEHPLAALPDVHADSPLFQFFHKTGTDYLAFNMVYSIPGESHVERTAKEQLGRFNPEFCFPFLFDQEIFGLLLIGEKTSGELYTPHDVRLLTELVKQLTVIINQIRLKKKILAAEELELLGRMSRGMAHDLNNLLTPVSTFLQLFDDGMADGSNTDELLPMALRNVTTMQAYIRESLFFSQHHTPQFALSRLDLLLHKAVDLAESHFKRKNISATVNAPPDTFAEVDAVLIQRLLGNLISNAVDASPSSTQLRVELQRLIKTETTRDWLRIRVIDEGEGIPRQNLKRIFSPYFTTKDRGDETRGFGLGLAICRQIVHLHGGNLSIASEEKRGTTVQVDLPSRQINRAPLPAAVQTPVETSP
jgi:signal transduction histidine kinase